MDLALTFGTDGTEFDLLQGETDLSTDSGLRSAVIASLFTDRRAEADDELPDGGTDRRGSWQDAYLETDSDRQGSRLWLLSRAKQIPETLTRAQEYASEALEWLLEDEVAIAVQVTAEWVRRGVLGLRVSITLPDRTTFDDVFNYPLEAA